MEISRHWRLRKTRYGNAAGGLIGEECPHCEEKIFPPRDICPRCRWGTLSDNLNVHIGPIDTEILDKLAPLILRDG